MISLEDETYIDLATSCTKDEAVARLLGWMRGPIRKRHIEISDAGISCEALPHLHSLGGPLQDLLAEMRESARQDFYRCLEDIATRDESNVSDQPPQISQADFELLSAKESTIQKCDERIEKAYRYSIALDGELNSPESELVIDPYRTQKGGEPCITLDSLERWALTKLGLSVLGYDDGTSGTNSPLFSSDNSRSGSAQSTQDESSNNTPNPHISNERSLMITVCLLMIKLSETGPKYRNGKDINPSQIAKSLAKLAEDLGIEKGQGEESIRKRLGSAKNFLNEVLPQDKQIPQ